MISTKNLQTLVLAATTAVSASPALAHLDPVEHGSLAAGFSHPLFGPDHILAMVAVGLWACTLGGRAILAVPAAFVGTMMLGFVAAMLELPLPFVEPVILASVVVIGLLSAVALRLPTGPAMALIGFFAFFHGHAHGGELGSAGAMEFAVGFAIATALLHGAGIGLGWLLGRSSGLTGTRIAGAATALAGLWLAVAG